MTKSNVKSKGAGSSYRRSLIYERNRDVAFIGEWNENETALYSPRFLKIYQLTSKK